MIADCALGIDIGGTTTKLALVAAGGEVRAMDTMPTSCVEGGAGFVAELMNRVDAIMVEGARGSLRSAGIALAVAGLLDSRRDRLVYGPNLQALNEIPLVKLLSERFGGPVALDTDCNAACLGELRFGAGQGSRRLLSLVVGTGLGVGVAVEGRILRIAHECVGDAGHLIVQPGGPMCSSGCHGCAEAFVSAGAVESRYQNVTGSGLQTQEIIRSAVAGDANARGALEETGYWLGVAMASLATIFVPDCIVVAGGVAEAGDLLLSPAVRSFRACAAPFCSDGVVVQPATLGWRAAVVGAAAMLL